MNGKQNETKYFSPNNKSSIFYKLDQFIKLVQGMHAC